MAHNVRTVYLMTRGVSHLYLVRCITTVICFSWWKQGVQSRAVRWTLWKGFCMYLERSLRPVINPRGREYCQWGDICDGARDCACEIQQAIPAVNDQTTPRQHSIKMTTDTSFPRGMYERFILKPDTLWIGGITDVTGSTIRKFREPLYHKMVNVTVFPGHRVRPLAYARPAHNRNPRRKFTVNLLGRCQPPSSDGN